METKNSRTTKFSKMNIRKQNISKLSKILLGLLALGICFKGGFGCSQRSYQQKKEAAEYDRTTMGVLIDRKITEGHGNKNHIVFWLDTDNDPKTAEGFCSMPDADSEKTSNISSLANGTAKSLAEWRKIAHPYEVQHNPCEFLLPR